ncbi:heavy metal-associated isoprenylated plant protein 8-like [Cynara cardunculus var. scolymus]|uniref:Heavy metal-associated domain, HMA n=1 Tax=Cynara cardunculus var. scolymus TaxID=59895 RepID=A0A103YAU3_CYNCS|nr:heavy metal-associated isoprenylated plant protein 8-like [Cynara cardunculus var. scolymus]KVI05689.1 Heavy metal-associated domain, HMA [Cynara cardunculus var. scolymus]
MPKNKRRDNTEEQNHDGNSNDEDSNDSKTTTNKQSKGAIVLGVYLHCQGCVETVVKSLRGFDGVEEIEPNTRDHRVIVKGNNADPIRVAERVRNKLGKHVELISPLPRKQPEKKVEKKPETPKVVETVLKINLHCEGCAKDVRRCILKMKGVQTVNVDMKKSHVMVKGSFDPQSLIAYISKKGGRHAEMVNVKNKQSKNDGEQREGDQHENSKKEKEKEKEKEREKEKEKDGKIAYPNVPPGLVYAPQLFSDENPNACSIM